MQTNNSLRCCSIFLFIVLLSGCATSSTMMLDNLKVLAPNEGIAIGSLIIRGGDDIFGRTEWKLIAKKDNDSSIFPKMYSIIANRDGDEKIFALKMPAGDYTFYVLSQSGFSNAKYEVKLSFTIQPNKSVYIGKIIFEFPPGNINIFTKIRNKVVDAKDDITKAVIDLYGISLNKTDSTIAYSGSRHLVTNHIPSKYRSIKKDMNISEISNKLGSPVQKHYAKKQVFGIELKNGVELWEYHEGGHYIEAIWLVKFENDKVTDLGRSQGAILSDIKFGYLNK